MWVQDKPHPDLIKNNAQHIEIPDTITITWYNFGKEVFEKSFSCGWDLCITLGRSIPEFEYTSLCWVIERWYCSYLLFSIFAASLFFGKPFLLQSNHIFWLEPIVIPCLPWPREWEQYVQERSLKFLPLGLCLWVTDLENMTINCWCHLPCYLKKSLSILGENEVNTQTYADPKGER